MSNMSNKTLRLTESALMVAVATLLSIVVLFKLPQGGEVTVCSTLPLVLIGYRYGFRWGLLTSFVFSLIQLLLGLANLSYAANFGVAVVIVLFDYLLPYTLYGLSGLFHKHTRHPAGMVCLSLLCCTVVRYLCHVVSGYFVWSEWAEGAWLTSLCNTLGIGDATPLYYLLYSAGYNSFVFVDMAIAMAVAVALSLAINLSRPGVHSARHTDAKEG